MKAQNTLQYKNYTCLVSYSNVKDSLTGQVLGGNQIPSVTAQDVAGIKKAFHQAVDDYLADCERRGVQPAKAFSGMCTMRFSPSVHEALTIYAHERKLVLSKVLHEAVEEYLVNHNIELSDEEEN